MIKIRFSITLSILIFLFTVCKEKKNSENEPNDTFNAANSIKLNQSVDGFMNTAHDKDFFKLVIEKKTVLEIQISGIKGVNLALQVWRLHNKPELVKLADDNRKSSPEKLINLYVEPGTCFITVLHGEGDPKKENLESPYTLTVNSRDFLTEEMEPNDTIDEANPIIQNIEYTGFFSPGYNRLNTDKNNLYREEDWFLINISTDSELPALLDITLTGVDGINSALFLYSHANDLIIAADNNPAGKGEEIRGVGITKPGSCYVMVTAKGYSSSDQPYKIKYELKKYDPSDEMEPNNNFQSANIMSQNYIKGKISSEGDRDYFLFKPNSTRKEYYRIEVQTPEDLDLKASLYDSSRNLILTIDNSGTGTNEGFPDFCYSGDFYIAISARHNQVNGTSYYRLSVDKLDTVDNMESEPNDLKGKANPVNGNHITGYTSFKKDIDYFLLEYEMRVNMEFLIEGVKGGEIKVSITDPLGYILKSVIVKNNSQKKLIEFVDKKGYVIVESIVENYDYPYKIEFNARK